MDCTALKLSEFTSEKSGVMRLTLTDFRNYAYLRINAHMGPIVITGENGTGKTNILEAISFLTPGRGLRGARLADIKRITPALISDEYQPTVISNACWAVSALVNKADEEVEIGTAVEKSFRETNPKVLSAESSKLTVKKFPLNQNWENIFPPFGLRRKWIAFSEAAHNRVAVF